MFIINFQNLYILVIDFKCNFPDFIVIYFDNFLLSFISLRIIYLINYFTQGNINPRFSSPLLPSLPVGKFQTLC